MKKSASVFVNTTFIAIALLTLPSLASANQNPPGFRTFEMRDTPSSVSAHPLVANGDLTAESLAANNDRPAGRTTHDSRDVGQVRPEQPRQAGRNERVTIQHLGTTWGYSRSMTGFYSGTAYFDLVPVFASAYSTLSRLDKRLRYNCVIEESTFVPVRSADGSTNGGTYFVVAIDCG